MNYKLTDGAEIWGKTQDELGTSKPLPQVWVAYFLSSLEGGEKASMVFQSLGLGGFSVICSCYMNPILRNTKTKGNASH